MKLFNEEMEHDLMQLLNNQQITKVLELNKTIRENCKKDLDKYELSPTALPLYFTGRRDSKIVFVELNPGKGLLEPTLRDGGLVMAAFKNPPEPIKDIDDYITFCEEFGKYKAENEGVKIFDKKQIDFFSGFGGFEFSKDKYHPDNVINVRMNKLQLEIVPYSSNRFSFSYFKPDYIRERIDKIIRIIQSLKPDTIFVSGSQKIVSSMFGDINFQEIIIKGKKTHIGKKNIMGMDYLFIPSYKSRYILSTENIRKEYGEQCRRILNEE